MVCRVLLAEEHSILREGLRNILEGTAEFRVVGEAGTGLEAVGKTKTLRPALVIMAIGLPEMNGIDATREILRFRPETKIVVLSMEENENSVIAAFRSGVRGYVLKKTSSADFLEAVRLVARGGCYISPQAADLVLNRIRRGDFELAQTPLNSFSPREQLILRMVAEGKTSKDIANSLALAVETVRTYRKMLMKKTGTTNVAGLTRMALALGLTSLIKPTTNTTIF